MSGLDGMNGGRERLWLQTQKSHQSHAKKSADPENGTDHAFAGRRALDDFCRILGLFWQGADLDRSRDRDGRQVLQKGFGLGGEGVGHLVPQFFQQPYTGVALDQVGVKKVPHAGFQFLELCMGEGVAAGKNMRINPCFEAQIL